MNEQNFNLSKVKALPHGGLEVEYQLTEVIGDEPTVTDYKATHTRDIHPDMQDLFNDLRPVVGRVCQITSFLSLAESGTAGIGLTPSQEELCRKFAEELLTKIEVRGISWSGNGDKAGVVITAVIETPNGQKTCVNTPRLGLMQISYGFEEELESICENIKKEVFAFLFKGKQAQLSLFGDNSENEKPEE